MNNEEPVKDEEIKEEEVKHKAEPKTKSRAKPKIKITKEPVEPIEEEPVAEEEPAPVKRELKQIAKCPDCNMDVTVHTLNLIHKRRGFCKATKEEPEKNTRT